MKRMLILAVTLLALAGPAFAGTDPFLNQLTPSEKVLYEQKVKGDPLLEKKFIATRKFLRELQNSRKAPRMSAEVDITFTLNKDERTLLFDAMISQSSETALA